MAGYAFGLTDGMVLQVTQSGVAFDQLVQNRFDVVIADIAVAVTAHGLVLSVQNSWGGGISPRLSIVYKHVQTKVQQVTDVIPGLNGPKRVYGPMYSIGATATNDGTAVGACLPYDVTMSASLITTGPPGPNWGAKRFGPLPETTTDVDGETVEVVAATLWQGEMDAFFISPHFISATLATWSAVVVPGTAIAALPLPHPAINTLVRDVVATSIGTYVGSQSTRRVTPNSLRGH